MSKRTTKKMYADLKDNPFALFGPNVKVTLWPNGRPGIWITDAKGYQGLEITASCGPAGMGIEVRHFVGTAPLTVSPIDLRPGHDSAPAPTFDATHLEICQHYSDPYAQQFKAWYASDTAPGPNGTTIHTAPYPADLGLTPIMPEAR